MSTGEYWIRGQSGFELDCGARTATKTRVVFALYDQDHKRLAWYLFSSTVDAKSQRECQSRDVVFVTDDPFGVDAGLANHLLLRKEIGVNQLVSDAKSPLVKVTLAPNSSTIEVSLDNLNTTSNGAVRFRFILQKIDKPSRPNVPIPGKLYFLEVGPHPEGKFNLGPQGNAARKLVEGPVA